MDKRQLVNFLNRKNINYVLNAAAKNYSTFKGGGNIAVLILPQSNFELFQILIFMNNNIEFRIFGNLSKTLVSDRGYDGVVVLTKKIENIFNLQEKFICCGGANLNKLINFARQKDYGGLERLFSIPATVGGGIMQNCGSFGVEISDFLTKIEVFDLKNNDIKILNRQDLNFDYRKCELNNSIILNAYFEFQHKPREEITAQILDVVQKRRLTQPQEPSVGSVFKKSDKFASGYYVEQVGLKGFVHNCCKISEKHANFIVNVGNGKVNDYLYLKDLAKEKVFKEFNVVLEEEIIVL